MLLVVRMKTSIGVDFWFVEDTTKFDNEQRVITGLVDCWLLGDDADYIAGERESDDKIPVVTMDCPETSITSTSGVPEKKTSKIIPSQEWGTVYDMMSNSKSFDEFIKKMGKFVDEYKKNTKA